MIPTMVRENPMGRNREIHLSRFSQQFIHRHGGISTVHLQGFAMNEFLLSTNV